MSIRINTNQVLKVLHSEREWADRYDSIFSLVIFSQQSILIPDFIGKLQARIRVTDYIGWLKPNNLVILLYRSDGKEAEQFILSITSRKKIFTTFTYPEDFNKSIPFTPSEYKKKMGDEHHIGSSLLSREMIKSFFLRKYLCGKEL